MGGFQTLKNGVMCLARWLFINQLLINPKNEMCGGLLMYLKGVFVFLEGVQTPRRGNLCRDEGSY